MLRGLDGSAFLDRELYLFKSWVEDRERCRKAGIPDEASFSRKPDLTRRMLERALDKGVTDGWVTNDSVSGVSSESGPCHAVSRCGGSALTTSVPLILPTRCRPGPGIASLPAAAARVNACQRQ